MKIRNVHAVALNHALEAPYGMARGLTSARQTTLVVVEDENGRYGVGEAWGPGRATTALVEQFQEAFVGRSVYEVRGIIRRLWAAGYHMGYQGLQFGVWGAFDTAAWDLIARDAGKPLHALIGGKVRDRVLAYASTGYVTETNDIGYFEEQIQKVHDEGFRAIKIKIGLGPRSDEQRVAISRRILGEDGLVLVDINGAYTADVALASIERLRDLNVHWVEEPLSPEDKAGYQRLRSFTSVPIAAGEALYSRLALRDYIQNRLVDIIQPDINKIGGISEMCFIRDLAETNNLRFSPHCWAGGVAFSATLQVLATVTSYPAAADGECPLLLEFDRGHNPLRDAILRTPPAIEPDGTVRIPDQPGLGVELDWDAIQELTLDGKVLEVTR